MIIDYRVIPHREQRYETLGDYWWDGQTLHIRVSHLKDPRHEYLIFVHEVVEATMVRCEGGPDESTEFDRPYEAARLAQIKAPCGCLPSAESEPGDDVHAPYYTEHGVATVVENVVAFALDVRPEDYDVGVKEPL